MLSYADNWKTERNWQDEIVVVILRVFDPIRDHGPPTNKVRPQFLPTWLQQVQSHRKGLHIPLQVFCQPNFFSGATHFGMSFSNILSIFAKAHIYSEYGASIKMLEEDCRGNLDDQDMQYGQPSLMAVLYALFPQSKRLHQYSVQWSLYSNFAKSRSISLTFWRLQEMFYRRGSQVADSNSNLAVPWGTTNWSSHCAIIIYRWRGSNSGKEYDK